MALVRGKFSNDESFLKMYYIILYLQFIKNQGFHFSSY